MSQDSNTVLESRAATAVYFAPLVLAGGALALLVAWLIMLAVGVDPSVLGLWGLIALVGGVFSVAFASVWTWGAWRSRVVITGDELTVTPHLAKARSVQLSTLSRVGLRVAGGNARILELADAAGASADIGLGVWEREPEILRLIADAAERSGANVDPAAAEVLGGTD